MHVHTHSITTYLATNTHFESAHTVIIESCLHGMDLNHPQWASIQLYCTQAFLNMVSFLLYHISSNSWFLNCMVLSSLVR